MGGRGSNALTKAERETIVRFNAEDNEMVFETFNRKHAERLIKAGADIMRQGKRGDHHWWTLSMPRGWFRWPRPPRAVSQETRERLAMVRQKVHHKSPVTAGEAIGPLDLPMPVAVTVPRPERS